MFLRNESSLLSGRHSPSRLFTAGSWLPLCGQVFPCPEPNSTLAHWFLKSLFQESVNLRSQRYYYIALFFPNCAEVPREIRDLQSMDREYIGCYFSQSLTESRCFTFHTYFDLWCFFPQSCSDDFLVICQYIGIYA